MSTPAVALARWAAALQPDEDDLALARGALLDTVAVVSAAREHALLPLFEELGAAGSWAARAHVLDFDDLHLPSTTHISAVCVPATLAAGGGARAYLAGAGTMARLGSALGWRHYAAGWHATCTAGAPAAAVAAAVAMELGPERIAAAMALAVPAAGGVQRAFGSAAKALQVGFAAEAGVRGARLAAEGATADPRALEDWMRLVGGDPRAPELVGGDPRAPEPVGGDPRAPELVGGDPRAPEPVGGDPRAPELNGPVVPGGLAVKLYPCCYALQRPISAVAGLPAVEADEVRRILVRTPESSLKPLIHGRPTTGLEGKFSLEYGVAAAILDRQPELQSFTDEAVARPAARRLVELVEVEACNGGEGLLAGEVEIEVMLAGDDVLRTCLAVPPGAPDRPANQDELTMKLVACAPDAVEEVLGLDWTSARAYLTARA